jgi:uncharacterized protein YlxP (DUF503 family)
VFVGLLQFEMIVHGSTSLKDKRRVVRSVKDRLHREHLVSIAEIAGLDHHRLAVMGLAFVSNSEAYVNSVLDAILDKLGRWNGAQLGEFAREVIRGDSTPDELSTEPGPLWTEQERREPETPEAPAPDPAPTRSPA